MVTTDIRLVCPVVELTAFLAQGSQASTGVFTTSTQGICLSYPQLFLLFTRRSLRRNAPRTNLQLLLPRVTITHFLDLFWSKFLLCSPDWPWTDSSLCPGPCAQHGRHVRVSALTLLCIWLVHHGRWALVTSLDTAACAVIAKPCGC